MEARETFPDVAAIRIRTALLALNILLAAIGGSLVGFGAYINRYMTGTIPNENFPELWWIGFLPLTIGSSGIMCALSSQRLWMALWTIINPSAHIMGYVAFVMCGGTDINRFHISIQVFGSCSQVAHTCRCPWEDRSHVAVLTVLSCDELRRGTIYYLSFILLLVFSLTLSVIELSLACILTWCLQHCTVWSNLQSLHYTTIHGANFRGSIRTNYDFENKFRLPTSLQQRKQQTTDLPFQDGASSTAAAPASSFDIDGSSTLQSTITVARSITVTDSLVHASNEISDSPLIV